MNIYVKRKIFSKTLNLYWYANSLSVGPQLNNIFGYYGINSNLICEKFNNETLVLPEFFLLQVTVFILKGREFNFFYSLPSISFFIKLISFDKLVFCIQHGRMKNVAIRVITIQDIFLICKIKKYNYKSMGILRSIFFTIRSMRIKVIY